MNKKFLLIVFFILVLFCTACSKIPKLEFAQAGIDLSQDFDAIINNLSDEQMDIFGKPQPVYKIIRNKADQNLLKKIGDIFDMSLETKKTNVFYDEYSTQDKSLHFSSNTSFSYSYTPQGYENVPITIDDDTLIKQATAFLQEHGLLPSDFVYSGMGRGELEYGDSHSHVYEKTVGFKRLLNGHTVIGNSHINVGFYQNSISSLSVQYNEYKDKKNVNTVSYEKAIAQLKEPDIIFEYDAEKITAKPNTIELSNAEIVYVDHAYDKNAKYIQPAYRFKGTISDIEGHRSDFSAVVRAVSE